MLAWLLKFREHILNTGSFMVLRLISLGLFFFSTRFFIQTAGSEAYGALTLLLVLFNFVGYLDLGTGYTLQLRYTRALARHKPTEDRIRLLRRAMAFYCLMFGLVLLAGLPLGNRLSQWIFSEPDYAPHLQLVTLALAILFLDTFLAAIIRGHNRVFQANIALFVFDLFRNLALIAGALTGGDLMILMATIVAGALLKTLYSFLVCLQLEPDRRWLWPSWHLADFRLNFLYGLPMLGTAALGILMANIDKLLIGKYVSLSDLSYYSIAADVNNKAWVFVFAISSSLYTVFIRRHSRRESVQPLIVVSFLSIAAVSILYYLPLSLFARELLSLWVGPDIAEPAAPLVRLHAVSAILYLCSTVFYGLLQSQGQRQALFGIYAIGTLILAGLLSWLPAQAGVQGYAWSYIVLYAFLTLALGWVSFRRTKGSLPPLRNPT